MFRISLSTLILLIIFLASCATNDAVKSNWKEKNSPFPIVLDTLDVESIYRYTRDSDINEISTAEYHFNYIGKYRDTIYPSFIIFKSQTPEYPVIPNQEEDKRRYLLQTIFQKYHIENELEKDYRWSDSSIEIRINTSNKLISSYPVLLQNTGKDTVYIGRGQILPIVMEAQDKQGKWCPIQDYYPSGCGTGLGYIFLPPNEIALTMAPIFHGNYRTKLRLKLGKNYSNVFTGHIRYSQFKYRK